MSASHIYIPSCHYLFLTLYMQIGCINYTILCINVSLRDGNLSVKHVAEFMCVDDM